MTLAVSKPYTAACTTSKVNYVSDNTAKERYYLLLRHWVSYVSWGSSVTARNKNWASIRY